MMQTQLHQQLTPLPGVVATIRITEDRHRIDFICILFATFHCLRYIANRDRHPFSGSGFVWFHCQDAARDRSTHTAEVCALCSASGRRIKVSTVVSVETEVFRWRYLQRAQNSLELRILALHGFRSIRPLKLLAQLALRSDRSKAVNSLSA